MSKSIYIEKDGHPIILEDEEDYEHDDIDEDEDDEDDEDEEDEDEINDEDDDPGSSSIEDDVDGEEEDEEEEEDEVNCDDEEDDYSSSTSSTSSTNNQTDNPRVCDCCYCEVFGHGVPPVAPTSRNYNEMRERLRLRLSKRRAERCERSAQQSGGKEDSLNDKGGGTANVIGTNEGGGGNANTNGATNGIQSSLLSVDELLKFINGTSHKDQDKSSSKRKDKNKNSNNNKKNNNNNNNSKNNNNSQKATNKDSDKSNKQNHKQTSGYHHHQHKQAQNQRQNQSSTPSSTRSHVGRQQNHPPRVAHKSDKDGRLISATNGLVSEDVFMPRDIDLNDNELDEFERELEAFKRFCLDSDPLVKRERVRLQLKDTNFLQELARRF